MKKNGKNTKKRNMTKVMKLIGYLGFFYKFVIKFTES